MVASAEEKNLFLMGFIEKVMQADGLKQFPRAEKHYLAFCMMALLIYFMPGLFAAGVFGYGTVRYIGVDKPKQDELVNAYLKQVKNKGFFTSSNLLDSDEVKIIGGKAAMQMAIETRINKI